MKKVVCRILVVVADAICAIGFICVCAAVIGLGSPIVKNMWVHWKVTLMWVGVATVGFILMAVAFQIGISVVTTMIDGNKGQGR